MLADGRFPDGSHAHSFGMEAAVASGRVHDPVSLREYIEVRLWTTTRTEAAERGHGRGRGHRRGQLGKPDDPRPGALR